MNRRTLTKYLAALPFISNNNSRAINLVPEGKKPFVEYPEWTFIKNEDGSIPLEVCKAQILKNKIIRTHSFEIDKFDQFFNWSKKELELYPGFIHGYIMIIDGYYKMWGLYEISENWNIVRIHRDKTGEVYSITPKMSNEILKIAKDMENENSDMIFFSGDIIQWENGSCDITAFYRLPPNTKYNPTHSFEIKSFTRTVV